MMAIWEHDLYQRHGQGVKSALSKCLEQLGSHQLREEAHFALVESIS